MFIAILKFETLMWQMKMILATLMVRKLALKQTGIKLPSRQTGSQVEHPDTEIVERLID